MDRQESPLGGSGYGLETRKEPSWTLDQILLATGGRLVSGEAYRSLVPNAAGIPCFRSISTDSRTITSGDIFLALSGENFDGLAFTAQAISLGASGLIVDRAFSPLPPVPVVLVEDCLRALGDLAAYRRGQIKDMKVLAITGSSGKTTVKDMTASILGQCGETLKTKGNFNNLVGLPLSLLPANCLHGFGVLEMGMNAPGEIARLTEIADPDVACITNVHPAHLAGLGSIEGVARAKGELFAGCREATILAVNLEDPLIRKMVRGLRQKMIPFGFRREAVVRATRVVGFGQQGVAFTLNLAGHTARVRLRVLGRHNVLNALAAAASAYAVGAGIDQIVSGLQAFSPGTNRLGLCPLPCGLQVINDSYNANPSSMNAALATVAMIRKGERTVAVLGDMLELGAASTEAHTALGSLVVQYGFDYLCAIGEYAGTVVAAARSAGMTENAAHHCLDKEEAAAIIHGLLAAGHLQCNDLILVKGSRGMRMEQVIAALNP